MADLDAKAFEQGRIARLGLSGGSEAAAGDGRPEAGPRQPTSPSIALSQLPAPRSASCSGAANDRD